MGRVLERKVALVIGAGSSGPGWSNGKATAVQFAREGAKVAAVDISLAAAEETAGIIAAEGGDALALRADASNPADIQSLVASCMSHYGRIDILQHNVGIVELGGPVEQSLEEWNKVLATNLTSLFLCCKHVLPIMERQGVGVITVISSIAGVRWTGVPYISYSATKAAAIQFARCVALQYARKGIRANSIIAGQLNTPMVHKALIEVYGNDISRLIEERDAMCPTGRMGEPWDVAHASVYLASERAKYVTATSLTVDGGLTAKYA